MYTQLATSMREDKVLSRITSAQTISIVICVKATGTRARTLTLVARGLACTDDRGDECPPRFRTSVQLYGL